VALYTERHGMRQSIERTEIINPAVYNLLLECCQQYYKNIAKKFLNYDGCGIDERKLGNF
jgi:hypothetical protein